MSTTNDDTIETTPGLKSRPGFALAMTLGAIIIIGTLIAGSFYVSTQQTRTGQSNLTQENAFRYAEAGLAAAVSGWDKTTANALATGASYKPTISVTGVSASYQPVVTVARVNSTLFLVTSETTVGAGAGSEATRRVSQYVRMMSPTFNVLGALTVRGNTQIGGSSFIDGNDNNPSTWSCPAEQAAKAGIATPATGNVTTSGCSGLSCVAGDPKIQANTAAAADSTYFKYGDYTWEDLKAMRSVTIPVGNGQIKPEPVVTNNQCNVSGSYIYTNWGDVNRSIIPGKCESYFPVIYFAGDAKLTGGSGQGILLVEGDLEVQGGFEFFGPVIVKGRLRTAGTGGHFNGAVMAANVDLELNSVLGDALISYSSCAISTVMKNVGKATPVLQRSWAEVY